MHKNDFLKMELLPVNKTYWNFNEQQVTLPLKKLSVPCYLATKITQASTFTMHLILQDVLKIQSHDHARSFRCYKFNQAIHTKSWLWLTFLFHDSIASNESLSTVENASTHAWAPESKHQTENQITNQEITNQTFLDIESPVWS